MASDKLVRIGTRGSQLALWQAHHIADLLQAGGMSTEIIIIETTGDKIQNQSFVAIGSKGLFTQELEDKLQSAEIDIAVHSAKDLQSELGKGLEILAFTPRETANDVVVSFDPEFCLENAGSAVVGSSSTRRRAVLNKIYPGIKLVEARGNLQTRFKKMEEGQYKAMLLAYAGVHRLGYDKHIVQTLSLDIFTPAAGQGTLAIETSDAVSSSKRAMIRSLLNHQETEQCILAERAYLKGLDGGCSIPSFAYAQKQGDAVHLNAGLISLDGTKEIRKSLTMPVSRVTSLGKILAEAVLNSGGREMLKEIRETIKK